MLGTPAFVAGWQPPFRSTPCRGPFPDTLQRIGQMFIDSMVWGCSGPKLRCRISTSCSKTSHAVVYSPICCSITAQIVHRDQSLRMLRTHNAPACFDQLLGQPSGCGRLSHLEL